ncbi:MAG TPA: helix-turn-helix domain-containing protein [Blastocatellia bacterium]|nr:helix-turn-helix domain-containing protein [Blastocatellia bacterium]
MKSASKKKGKPRHMNDDLFGDLMQSLDQALRYSRGEQVNVRTTVLPAPPEPMSKKEIIQLREQLNCSQAVFAHLLNVSVKTLQAWEQGVRTRGDVALKLLTIAKHHPEVLLS